MLVVKIRMHDSTIQVPKIVEKSDWVDLRLAEDLSLRGPMATTLKRGTTESRRNVVFEHKLVSLGISMELPKGFEALVLPRSSTPKKGILLYNSMGVIDNSYNGDDDIWKFNAVALEDCNIPAGTRICQFRIQLSQNATVFQKLKWLFSSKIKFEIVDTLSEENRGGFGSTGDK